MSGFKKNHDPMTILRLKNERILQNYSFLDRTDTASIASVESSIFDLDSSFASYVPEKPVYNQNHYKSTKNSVPTKTRSFKFKDKVPENWLYSPPPQTQNESSTENPLEWMRTVFEENDVVPLSYRSNLSQTLWKSQANLSSINNYDFLDDIPAAGLRQSPLGGCNSPAIPATLPSYKSVSDLKNIEITDRLQKNNYSAKDRSIMTESKTAPGSIENITEFRSSFQDFIALAKQQEEKLKAEVLKRKLELNEPNRDSIKSKPIPSVKYIKNSRKSVPINRFGYTDSGGQTRPPLTRYSRPNTNSTRFESVSSFNPKSSPQINDFSQSKFSDKSRLQKPDNVRQSANSKTRLKLYNV